MSESDFDASAADVQRCPQCGAVGTKQWQRADGVPVCDEVLAGHGTAHPAEAGTAIPSSLRQAAEDYPKGA